MTWDIQVLPRAEKALKKLDKPHARRIRDALVRLAGLDDPASAGKARGGGVSMNRAMSTNIAPVERFVSIVAATSSLRVAVLAAT